MLRLFINIQFLLFLFISFSANAALVGTTVSICADSGYYGSVKADISACRLSTAQPLPSSTIVTDPGVEFSLTNTGIRTFDFSEDYFSITYDSVTSYSPDLYVFEFDSFLPSNLTLITENVLNVTTLINQNFLGVLVSSPLKNGTVTFTLSEVPVPSSLLLITPMMFGFIALRKKMKS